MFAASDVGPDERLESVPEVDRENLGFGGLQADNACLTREERRRVCKSCDSDEVRLNHLESAWCFVAGPLLTSDGDGTARAGCDLRKADFSIGSWLDASERARNGATLIAEENADEVSRLAGDDLGVFFWNENMGFAEVSGTNREQLLASLEKGAEKV